MKKNYIESIRKHIGKAPMLSAGAALFVFNEKHQVLMQLRADFKMWGFIGGAMELGETFEETAVRELKEETNLNIVDLKFIKLLSGNDCYIKYPNGDEVYSVTAIYVVTKHTGDLELLDDESLELKWFDIDNLPDKISPGTKKRYIDGVLDKALQIYINENK